MRLFRCVSILTVALATATALPAVAQSLPDWAAPYEPSGPYGAGFSDPGTRDETWVPNIPDAPGKPVPIDGGLGLLAAAGAGYAIKKLRRRT